MSDYGIEQEIGAAVLKFSDRCDRFGACPSDVDIHARRCDGNRQTESDCRACWHAWAKGVLCTTSPPATR